MPHLCKRVELAPLAKCVGGAPVYTFKQRCVKEVSNFKIERDAIVADGAQAEEMKRYGLEGEITCFIDVSAVNETDVPFSPKPVDPGQIALLQHSSGTTGLKKGMALSHRAILNQIRAYAETITLKDDDTIISWLPLYHDMGLIGNVMLP